MESRSLATSLLACWGGLVSGLLVNRFSTVWPPEGLIIDGAAKGIGVLEVKTGKALSWAGDCKVLVVVVVWRVAEGV